MTLAPGARLGGYEVLGRIGAGGMGEVFRARDTRLNRDVALKILPEAFTHDPDRIARFKREAQVLASLNHPHVAAIHGLDEADGWQFLVLELVEGEDLAQRLLRGPIAVDDALPIARQIADALEAAHDQGIVHRDLKPANIKVRADGTVKVLDFGLAKAIDAAQGVSPSADRGHLATASPTITSPAMTQAGVILGTAAYMSPEQAKGRAADKRSDIWAFGCVVYEMLTGKRPFEGEDISDTLAAVLRGDPDWNALPANTPLHIRTLLRRCLQKDPRKRLPHVGVARLELDEDGASPPPAGAVTPAPARAAWRRAIPYAIAIAATTLITILLMQRLRPIEQPLAAPLHRLMIVPPATAAFVPGPTLGTTAYFAISRDGSRIVYVGQAPDGARSLYLRFLDQLDARQLPGTENAMEPFFSPDGEWVGFFVNANPILTLKKVAVRGGAATTMASFSGVPGGAFWRSDGDILLSLSSIGGPGIPQSLFVLPASGGTPRRLEALTGTLKRSYGMPNVLPGDAHMLVSIRTGQTHADAHVDVMSLDGKVVRTVIDNGYHARYVSPGHIVYLFGRNLMTVPFDPVTLQTNGVPSIPAENLGPPTARGDAMFDVSQTGVLVYASAGDNPDVRRTFMWVDRKGQEEVISAPPRAYTYPRLSPDGQRLALDVRDQQNDLWTWDLARHILSRVTVDAGLDYYPVWAPNNGRLAYASSRSGAFNLYWQNADGTGTAERLSESPNTQAPYCMTPDGKWLLYRDSTPTTGDDLAAISLTDLSTGTAKREVLPLIHTTFNERNGEISPDGRWIAYESDESGREEVYVRPFPNVDSGRWPISSGGGTRPAWARSGRELFYLVGQTPTPVALVRVAIDTSRGFSASAPEEVFEGQYYVDPRASARGRTYDVSADGLRFVMIKDIDPQRKPSPQPLIVVTNWVAQPAVATTRR
jgi:serine/threonine-protein kinase